MKPRGRNCVDTTTAPMSRYVATTGSDVSGKGTAAIPYASVVRAMQDIPPRIAHPVNIYIASGSYGGGTFPRHIDNTLIDDGSLSIFGVGAPTRKAVTGGPHTVASVVDIEEMARRITVAGAVWAVDEFCGYWVRIITGGHPGQTFPVYGNGTNTICVDRVNPGTIHNGDTIELIAPSTKITIDTELDLFYDLHSLAGDPANPPGVSHLTLANLWLDATASTNVFAQLSLHGIGLSNGPNLEFVRFDAQAWGVVVEDIHPNCLQPIDDTFVAACGSGIANLGAYGETPGLSLTSAGLRADLLVTMYGDNVLTAAVSGQVESTSGGYCKFMGGAASFKSWVYVGDVYAWLSGVSNAKPGVHILGGVWTLNTSIERDCNYAIDTDGGAIVRIHGDLQCSATLCALSAVRIGPMCKVTSDHALGGFLGATVGQQAYIFKMNVAVKSATWPVAGTYVTDTKGGEFLRVT